MFTTFDIPAEEVLRAAEEIKKTKGKCLHFPMARFCIPPGSRYPYPVWDGLICDSRADKMGGKSTGIAAPTCLNCVLYGKTKGRNAKEKKLYKTETERSFP
jgi:hypothetical protein